MATNETLDIGCGGAKFPGAVGIDVVPGPQVDIVHDLNLVPWPLAPDRFASIVASHVLEHLVNLVPVMEEIHRVAKPGARVAITTPHFSSLNSWEDPTHTRHFARRSFASFDVASPYQYTTKRFRTLSTTLHFGAGLWDHWGEIHYKLWPNFWEKQLAFIWRARDMVVELEVVK
ncbi:MAG: class I SAM-dependent methyltransferase [Candidatus Krumholzibacteria bacterium]|nr:class I SAM-dependent methyltransferase [Candidatus Krumholzibacteria bacterium]